MPEVKRAKARPLSPHLEVWRFHATMLASISHRLTGVALYFGTLLIAAWIVSLALGREAYAALEAVIFSIPGQGLMFLWAAAVLFHFANGIRHLLWDGPGIGFSPKVASQVSVFNFAFAIIGAAGLMLAASQL